METMKKIFFFSFIVIILCLLSQPMVAQTESRSVSPDSATTFLRNEFKMNLLMLFFSGLNLEYERLLNNESAIGLSAQVRLNNEPSSTTPPFQALGFYRLYFWGKKPTASLFMELNGGGYAFREEQRFFNPAGTTETRSNIKYSGFLGIAVGGKLLTKQNIVVDLYYGFERSLSHEHFIHRMGITLGTRF
jgi:hypothetical protein